MLSRAEETEEEGIKQDGSKLLQRVMGDNQQERSEAEDDQHPMAAASLPPALDDAETNHVLWKGIDTSSASSSQGQGAAARFISASANDALTLVEAQSSNSTSNGSAIERSRWRKRRNPHYSDHEGDIPQERAPLPLGSVERNHVVWNGLDKSSSSQSSGQSSQSKGANARLVNASANDAVYLVETQSSTSTSHGTHGTDGSGGKMQADRGRRAWHSDQEGRGDENLSFQKRRSRRRPCKGQRLRRKKQFDGLMAQVSASHEDDEIQLPPAIAENDRVRHRTVTKLAAHKAELFRIHQIRLAGGELSEEELRTLEKLSKQRQTEAAGSGDFEAKSRESEEKTAEYKAATGQAADRAASKPRLLAQSLTGQRDTQEEKAARLADEARKEEAKKAAASLAASKLSL